MHFPGLVSPALPLRRTGHAIVLAHYANLQSLSLDESSDGIPDKVLNDPHLR